VDGGAGQCGRGLPRSWMKSLDSLQASAQYTVFDAVSLFRISLSLKILWQKLLKREGLCKNTYRLGNFKVRERKAMLQVRHTPDLTLSQGSSDHGRKIYFPVLRLHGVYTGDLKKDCGL
jgi:hypothetical protein